MQFKDVIGQQEVKQRLVGSVDRGRISHAQLFTGDEGVGALPLAIAYAQYLNCPHPHDGDSCGVCPSCHQIGQLAHPDLHFVFPVNTPKGKSSSEKPLSNQFMPLWRDQVASTGGYFNEQMWYETIAIDNKQGNISTFEADEIIRALSFKAFESEYKVVLIWLPERMNVQAANKLLKILEEPWAGPVVTDDYLTDAGRNRAGCYPGRHDRLAGGAEKALSGRCGENRPPFAGKSAGGRTLSGGVGFRRK